MKPEFKKNFCKGEKCFRPICKECKDIKEQEICFCGHKRLVHHSKFGCSYCRFIEGRKYLHQFRRKLK